MGPSFRSLVRNQCEVASCRSTFSVSIVLPLLVGRDSQQYQVRVGLRKNSIRLPSDLNVTLLHSDRLAKLCFRFSFLKVLILQAFAPDNIFGRHRPEMRQFRLETSANEIHMSWGWLETVRERRGCELEPKPWPPELRSF
jgi:hypothetical protein